MEAALVAVWVELRTSLTASFSAVVVVATEAVTLCPALSVMSTRHAIIVILEAVVVVVSWSVFPSRPRQNLLSVAHWKRCVVQW